MFRSMLAATLYGIGISVFVYTLSIGDVTRVFPLSIGATVLLTNLLEYVVFKQKVSFRRVLGTVLLLSGITVIGLSET